MYLKKRKIKSGSEKKQKKHQIQNIAAGILFKYKLEIPS